MEAFFITLIVVACIALLTSSLLGQMFMWDRNYHKNSNPVRKESNTEPAEVP